MVFRFQGQNESLREFVQNVESASKALNCEMSELELVNIIIAHISPITYSYWRPVRKIETIEYLLDLGSEIEGAMLRDSQYNVFNYRNTPPLAPHKPLHESAHASVATGNLHATHVPVESAPMLSARGGQMLMSRQRPMPRRNITDGNNTAPYHEHSNQRTNTYNNSNIDTRRCFVCNQEGHFARFCDQRNLYRNRTNQEN